MTDPLGKWTNPISKEKDEPINDQDMEIIQDPEKNGNLHMNENCNSEDKMFTQEKLVTKQSGNGDSKDNNIANEENEIHSIAYNRDQNDIYETETVSDLSRVKG
ncbi:uncharacterized protein LOC143210765 [Lasioglossum baleicum]|uniref:uncharacterized protein LOC143210765 n=1 Tax=Lasioglossum baleicum TaxID=434251 RepID=UPI003FCC7B6C